MNGVGSDELPEGWADVPFGVLLTDAQNGCGVRSGSGIPTVVLRLADVSIDGTVASEGLRLIPLPEVARQKYRLEIGDLLAFRVNGSPGIVGQVIRYAGPVGATYCDHFIRFRVDPTTVLPAFLAHAFHETRVRREVEARMVSSAGQNTVSQASFREISIALPPLAEQHRIVDKVEALLAEVNAARDRLARVPAILKRFRQSVLAAACSGRLTEPWRDGGGGEVLSTNLSDVAEIIDPNPSHRYPSYENGTVPIVSTEQFRGLDGWDVTTAKLANAAFHAERLAAHGFEKDDIIFARKGRLGLARRAPSIPRYVFSHTMFIVRSKPSVDSDYLLWFLRQDSCVEWLLHEMNSNTGVPTLGKAYMERLPILVPPLAEQHEIVRRVDALFALADTIEHHLAAATARADKLIQSILVKAFRGELVPTEAELARAEGRPYESGAALLARIRPAGPARSDAPREPRGGSKQGRREGAAVRRQGTELFLATGSGED